MWSNSMVLELPKKLYLKVFLCSQSFFVAYVYCSQRINESYYNSYPRDNVETISWSHLDIVTYSLLTKVMKPKPEKGKQKQLTKVMRDVKHVCSSN